MLKLGMLGTIAVLLGLATAEGQIQASFFGMGVTNPTDLPKVSYGVLSHTELAWTAIEGRTRGVYDFTVMDQYVNGAPKDANGVAQVDVVMGWTPGWAVTSTKGCFNHNGVTACTSAPTNLTDWKNFITAVANHYNGVNAPYVQYYEIWNEANTTQFWTGGVTKLIQMAQVAYPILKQGGHSLVLTPSVIWSSGGTTFTTSYLSGGGSKYADGVTFHGYTSKTGKGVQVPLPESPLSTNAPIQTMVHTFRQIANSNGMSGKPLMTTEGGWGVNGVTDPDEQSAWIAQYEIVQAGLAVQNDLQFQTWYAWGQGSSGTIETAQGNPTSAGLAYQEVTEWLTGQSTTPCTVSGTVWSCAVGANLIVWNSAQSCNAGSCTTAPYAPPPAYVQYVDLTGTVHAISGTIALGVKPILMKP